MEHLAQPRTVSRLSFAPLAREGHAHDVRVGSRASRGLRRSASIAKKSRATVVARLFGRRPALRKAAIHRRWPPARVSARR